MNEEETEEEKILTKARSIYEREWIKLEEIRYDDRNAPGIPVWIFRKKQSFDGYGLPETVLVKRILA